MLVPSPILTCSPITANVPMLHVPDTHLGLRMNQRTGLHGHDTQASPILRCAHIRLASATIWPSTLAHGLVLVNTSLIGHHFSIEVQVNDPGLTGRLNRALSIRSKTGRDHPPPVGFLLPRPRCKSQNGSRLSHGFHTSAPPGITGILRKTPSEAGLIHGEIPDGMNRVFAVINIFDTINQQKGITMRENFTDLMDVQLRHVVDYPGLVFGQSLNLCFKRLNFSASVSRWRKLAAICNQSPCCRLGKTPVY